MSKTLQHGLFWLVLYVLWSYMKSAGTFWHVVLKVNVLNMGIYMFTYYTLRHYQLPNLYNQKKYGFFVLSLLLTSLFSYTIWRLFGLFWYDALYNNSGKRPFMTMVDFLTQTVQFHSPAVLLLAGESYHARQQEKVRIEQLEKEQLATELKFLKAQINPHFLFNTLNNLYSFVINQSPKAPDLILQLSGMLDYILYQSQKPTVSLRQELDCIENFLELEKIRYGERLQVTYETVGNLSVPVAPLILLSLIENAFKHGASGDIDQPKIGIHIKADDTTIHCHVWNTKREQVGELNDAYKEGIGLSNIQKQLKLTYPNRHELQIVDKKDAFSVNLKILVF